MAAGYIHVEVEYSRLSKYPGKPSGDVVEVSRDNNSTIIILCDGLGSGIQANIAATMTAARIKTMLGQGFSIREVFASVIKTMEEARFKDLPYSVFTVIRILNDGVCTILSYEMPPPVFMGKRVAGVMEKKIITGKDYLVYETYCQLKQGEGVFICSDGISQAGLGKGETNGWGMKKAAEKISDLLEQGIPVGQIPKEVNREAVNKWKNKPEDDLTSLVAYGKKEIVMNILTGPPENREDDSMIVKTFMESEGLKVVCGASTAKMLARVTGKEILFDDNYNSPLTPPGCEIEGIDLVTEGAVTLNQVCNVWGEDFRKIERFNPVKELLCLMDVANRVNVYTGGAKNPASDDISFAQQGLLPREKILSRLAEKLNRDGKTVTVNMF